MRHKLWQSAKQGTDVVRNDHNSLSKYAPWVTIYSKESARGVPMSWAKLDDSFPYHPKVVGLSDSAFRLHVTAICYCAQYLTDGEITSHALRRMDGRKRDIAELVNALLWETTDGKAYSIHDYLVYNESREKVEQRRVDRATAGVKGGVRSGISRSKREASASPVASYENEPPSRPVPERHTVSLSGDDEPPDVSEIRGMVWAKLSRTFQDAAQWEEVTLFARDYRGRHVDVGKAIEECWRAQPRELPFPGNLRKRLEPVFKAKPAPFTVVGS